MNERVCSFGNDAVMSGILCLPGEIPPRPDTIVVMLNAGTQNRVGPYRLYVRLARSLAGCGFASLRFDLSGIGDSEARRDTLTAEERVMGDVREAMDHLEQQGFRRFVLAGLCSGAVYAHKAATVDERVVGIVGLDGYAYPTPRFRARRLAYLGARPKKLLTIPRRVAAAVGQGPPGADAEDDPRDDEFGWEFPPRSQVRDELQGLVDRGVQMLLLFSGTYRKHYNYLNQFREGFPDLDFGECLQEKHFVEADHVYSVMSTRQILVDCICGWMNSFSAGA